MLNLFQLLFYIIKQQLDKYYNKFISKLFRIKFKVLSKITSFCSFNLIKQPLH